MKDYRKPTVDIIMPTYNSGKILLRSVLSIRRYTPIAYRLIIINNCKEQPIECDLQNLHVITLNKNYGWIGGINEGIKYIRKELGGLSKYVMFLNDDIKILDQDTRWLTNMLKLLDYYPEIGAVGPISNSVMGYQYMEWEMNMYHQVPVLSGFCFLTRKDIIEKVGLLDESLSGGDDLDYSIRIKKAGYKLACCRRTFVYHYYAQTGAKLHKDWDSQNHADRINRDIIRKHGLREFLNLSVLEETSWNINISTDAEMIYFRSFIPNNGKVIYDLGCGNNKVYPTAIGVDMIKNGEYGISGSQRQKKIEGVDCVADLNDKLPFENESGDFIVAKHVLEHITDHISALKDWNRILKSDGKLFMAIPDNNVFDAMACDPTHVHAFDKKSLDTVLDLTGYKNMTYHFIDGCFSFIVSAEKK